MKVILTKNVNNLGVEGEVKDVAPGYFYNYLMPNEMAEKATEEKIEEAEKKQKSIKKRKAKVKKNAEKVAKKLEKKPLEIEKTASDQGVLYAQLSPEEIIEKIEGKYELGDFEIKPSMVILENEIKKLGEYKIDVNLPGDTKAELTINIVENKE